MFAFAARFLFSYFIFVKKIIPRHLRDQHIMWKYTEVNRTWIKSVDVTGARGPMATENTSSIVLTQTSIDHQNLFIVFFMPSEQLQITFIVSGLVQLRLVKSRLLATTDPTELSTLFFFNHNTLNAHHSYIATGMRVIVEYNNVQDKWGLSNIHSTHTTQQRESSTLVRVKLNIHDIYTIIIHLECKSHLDIHCCTLDRVPEYTIVYIFSYSYYVCMVSFMIQTTPWSSPE